MESARAEALFFAGMFSLALLTGCAILLTVSWRAATGRLERNQYVGIRTPSTLRSDQAWVAGHRAGLRHAPLLFLAVVAISVVLFWFAWPGWRFAVIISGVGGVFVLIALAIYIAVVAGRAARAADPGTGHHTANADLASRPAPVILPPRVGAALAWAGAVIAWAATILALAGTCYGYVQSIHHHFPPNGYFGFRDSVTFSCLSAWYAGQKAGFGWALLGWGPFLVLNILLCPAAAIKGRSPRDLVALSMGTLLLGAVAVLIAGIHADNVARAITC